MIIQSPFKAAALMSNRHLQTILPNIVHPPFPVCRPERLELEDGDFIDLLHGQHQTDTPVLILHGLEGSIHSAYAKRVMNFCNLSGIGAVFMHHRNCSEEPNRLLRSYHSGATDDLKRVLTHLKEQSVSKVALLGYSLGGNIILKYLGEDIETNPLVQAAMVVSVPLELGICSDVLNQGFARIYQSILLKRLIRKMQYKQALLDQTKIDFPDPASMKNFRQFDHFFTAPVHGFDNAEDYYQRCSSRQFLKKINIPTLLIQSSDDPFMNCSVFPEPSELSSSVELELSSKGGHAGFANSYQLKQTTYVEHRLHQFLNDQNLLA
ncbi:MAG: putative alpha/beta-fold hydrolase [Gammaproteobacteria bacterium]|jgi:predicted alpha/beta-fold hydrolase